MEQLCLLLVYNVQVGQHPVESTGKTSWDFYPSKIEWDLTNGPPKKVARAIRYSSLGVRSSSVGPVGDFLDFRLKHDLFLLVTILTVVFTMGFLDAHWFSSSMALGAHVLPASPNWWRYPWCENPLPFFRFIIFQQKLHLKIWKLPALRGVAPHESHKGGGIQPPACMPCRAAKCAYMLHGWTVWMSHFLTAWREDMLHLPRSSKNIR